MQSSLNFLMPNGSVFFAHSSCCSLSIIWTTKCITPVWFIDWPIHFQSSSCCSHSENRGLLTTEQFTIVRFQTGCSKKWPLSLVTQCHQQVATCIRRLHVIKRSTQQNQMMNVTHNIREVRPFKTVYVRNGLRTKQHARIPDQYTKHRRYQ